MTITLLSLPNAGEAIPNLLPETQDNHSSAYSGTKEATLNLTATPLVAESIKQDLVQKYIKTLGNASANSDPSKGIFSVPGLVVFFPNGKLRGENV